MPDLMHATIFFAIVIREDILEEDHGRRTGFRMYWQSRLGIPGRLVTTQAEAVSQRWA